MSRNMIVVTEENRKSIEQIIPVQVGIGHVIAFGNDRALGYWADVTDPNSEDDWAYWETDEVFNKRIPKSIETVFNLMKLPHRVIA